MQSKLKLSKEEKERKLREYTEYSWLQEEHLYKERPVDIDTFIDDERFLGKIYGKNSVYPYWRKLLRKLYPTPFISTYGEVILSCAIGAGKSTVTTISMLYELYKLLCLKNPTAYYKLLESDTIVFMLFAATQGTAQDVNWGYISNCLAQSPFFLENLDFKETKAQSIELTDKIGIQIGSRAHKALGKAVLSAVLDEGNFGIVQDQVRNTYNAITRRRSSRFRQGFSVPGIVWLISSPQTGEDFINERIKKSDGNKSVLVVDNVPIWAIKAEKAQYCGETFPVFLGDELQDPKILDTEKEKLNYPTDLIMDVPVEHREEFEADLLEAIRDIGGRRISSSLNVFRSVAQLNKTFRRVNIFKSDTMPVNLGTTLLDFQNYLNMPMFNSALKDSTPRTIHLDYAFSGDRFGMASCMANEREVFDPASNEIIRRHYYTNDLAIGFYANSAEGMPSSAIAEFIIWLRDQGYPISIVTGDKPASNTVLPELAKAGIKTEYLSVDTTREPYLSFRHRHLMNEYIGVNNKILIKELGNVRDLLTKIDHPAKFPDGSKGSKDIADAIVGSYYKCFMSALKPSAAQNTNEAVQKIVQSQKDKLEYQRAKRANLLSKLY